MTALPLLPYSQLVFDLMSEVPGVYWIPAVFRIRASEVDIPRLEAAVRKAIRNHPVLSMRLDSDGHHPCSLPDEFNGQFHRVEIRLDGDFVLVTVAFNRVLGDMTSLQVLADDISKAYKGLELERDSYNDYLKRYWEQRDSVRYSSSEKWLDAEFGSLTCPVRPTADMSPYEREFQDAGILCDTVPVPEAFLQKEHITATGFVSLCAALAIMDFEGTDAAALTWAYMGRDTKEEQRIFGSLHRDIPFVITRSSDPEKLLRQTRVQLRSGIAHSDCPYTLTPPHTEIWNYAVNVLQQSDLAEILSSFPFPVEVMAPAGDAAQRAYSLLDIELKPVAAGTINLVYRYSAAHYRRGSMGRFASLLHDNALWLTGGHHRVVNSLRNMISSDPELGDVIRHSIASAAGNCPDLRMNPVRSLEDLYAFLDRFLVSKPWESLGLEDGEMSLFRRVDQSTGYFLYLFDQPLPELEGRGYLYPSAQYIPSIASWIKDFNNAWREYLDSPLSWDEVCLGKVSSDPVFGMNKGWYEPSQNWHCWNDFFSRRLSGPAARPQGSETVIAPCDGILRESWAVVDDSRLSIPEAVILKTASVCSVRDLLQDSQFNDSFAGGLFVHQTLDFYDYHRFHSPVDGTVLDVRIIDGISGSGGVVVWNRKSGQYEYSNPGEPGFQMLETRGVVVIDAGERLGLVAMVPVGMAQVCSVNWLSGIRPGSRVRKGEELGFFLCGGSDIVLLFQKNVILHPVSDPGRHLLMGEGLFE